MKGGTYSVLVNVRRGKGTRGSLSLEQFHPLFLAQKMLLPFSPLPAKRAPKAPKEDVHDLLDGFLARLRTHATTKP